MTYKKILKVTCLTPVIIFVVIIIFNLFLNYYFDKSIINELEKKANVASHGEYGLSVGSVKINLFTMSITIKNSTLAPLNMKDTSLNFFVLTAPIIKIKELSIWNYLINKKIGFNEIEMEGSALSIFMKDEKQKNKMKNTKNSTLKISELSVKKINLKNFRLTIFKNNHNHSFVLGTVKNSLSVQDLKVKMEPGNKSSISISESNLEINKLFFHEKNNIYSVFIKKISASSMDSSLIIDSLQLIPNYSKSEFFKIAVNYINRVQLFLPKLVFEGADINNLLFSNIILTKKLKIQKMLANIYRDNNYPVKKNVKASAQALIRDIPLSLKIDSVFINSSELFYEELSTGAKEADDLNLKNINATITGINNDSVNYTSDSKMEATVSASFMNQGLFTSDFIFHLNTRAENFKCKGTISSMPMSALNPIFEHSKNILITAGKIDSAYFSFFADPKTADGKMVLQYHGLVINAASSGSSIIEAKLKTFAINNFIIEKSNPGNDNKIRVADIHVAHDPYRYFPYYSREAIMSGLINSIVGDNKGILIRGKK